MPTAGLKTIIALSFVLAVGFLLVILSCALWKIYYPLLVVATYIIAPVPNWVCGRWGNPDDFAESSGGAVLDLGRFLTGFFVVMGIGESDFFLAGAPLVSVCHDRCWRGCVWGVPWRLRALLLTMSCSLALPIVLAHSDLIRIEAMIMSIVGGLLIYGTVISFGMFFQEDQEF